MSFCPGSKDNSGYDSASRGRRCRHLFCSVRIINSDVSDYDKTIA